MPRLELLQLLLEPRRAKVLSRRRRPLHLRLQRRPLRLLLRPQPPLRLLQLELEGGRTDVVFGPGGLLHRSGEPGHLAACTPRLRRLRRLRRRLHLLHLLWRLRHSNPSRCTSRSGLLRRLRFAELVERLGGGLGQMCRLVGGVIARVVGVVIRDRRAV
jgi:hypothetical protein